MRDLMSAREGRQAVGREPTVDDDFSQRKNLGIDSEAWQNDNL
jgi:hypothetical protein